LVATHHIVPVCHKFQINIDHINVNITKSKADMTHHINNQVAVLLINCHHVRLLGSLKMFLFGCVGFVQIGITGTGPIVFVGNWLIDKLCKSCMIFI
jgi:hypothetical protein